MMAHPKRKREFPLDQASFERTQEERQRSLANLRVQAYEADITRGPSAATSAQALEYIPGKGPGSALIAWGGARGPATWNDSEDVFSLGSEATQGQRPETTTSPTIWVDRYDARLLLDPAVSWDFQNDDSSVKSPPPSPSPAWSDLDEDGEETFLLSRSEAEEHHRAKRRRLLDEAWERRRRERELEDAQEIEKIAVESGVDDEPSAEMLLLMQRTATHLLSASNAAQLEMRILANHGADDRFAFLREGGRCRNVWLRVKQEVEREKQPKSAGAGLGALASYSSDEGGSTEDEEEVEEIPPPPLPDGTPPPPPPPPPLPPTDMADEELKAARREKARKWLQERRRSES